MLDTYASTDGGCPKCSSRKVILKYVPARPERQRRFRRALPAQEERMNRLCVVCSYRCTVKIGGIAAE